MSINMKRAILMAGILVAVVLSGCSRAVATVAEGQPVTVYGGSYRNITATQLKSWLEDKDFLLVNVHVPHETDIPGTDEFVAYNEIDADLSLFPPNKGARIVVYCRSGAMSAIAAKALVRNGYTNVWNLDSGMIAWESQGGQLIPVVR